MAHAPEVLAAIRESLPLLKAETEIMKLELGLIFYISRIEHKQQDEARAFSKWLSSLDDDISKQIAFSLEMAVYKLNIALDMLSIK